MLDKPIQAGRVYLNGLGEERGPMVRHTAGLWRDQVGLLYLSSGFASGLENADKFSLVSRVKTPKADKPKKPKWRDAWVVMKGDNYSGVYNDYQQGVDGEFTQHRARVRIEPEE
jgi:hypothetical protein